MDNGTSIVAGQILEGSIFVFTVLGCFGNSNIVIATIKFKELQTKCGFLLAILACCDGSSLLFECWSGIRLVTDTAAMTQKKCFALQVGYIIVENTGVFMILAVSVDRQLAIQTPMKYRHWDTKTYVLRMIVIPVLYGFVYPISTLVVGIDPNEVVGMCNLPTSMPYIVSVYWNYLSTAACAATVLCYAITYFMLYKVSPEKLNAKSSQIMQQRKIVNTLSINVIGFFISSVATALTILYFRNSGASQDVIDAAETYAAIPGLISFTINYYIYFWRSSDYRKAFSRLLHLEKYFVKEVNITVVPQSTAISLQRTLTVA
ncbi:unnamed protein product [Bursaphelenchus xylophilus]|uniref:(pine wood nematode) hypothetical protein n=1 Tax=Bursaphelenchus xylophilus TaxID=6326 RepID=A0A1I7RV84_BURXY|nr:srsx-17 [Bursaphelenchus xylophilus]CAD5210509.1 unnamed protein product [Bursaphelenchus xylophilus]CAG9086521.1 unnamed protein product [Bursaphelenchus xylophilus]